VDRFVLNDANARMSQNRVEDLKVYQRAVAAADAVFALTTKVAFNRDQELRQQMRSSSGRIQTHLQEGSGQSTDKHYAHYVNIACGSAKEMNTTGRNTTKSPRCSSA
jgi:four helix bundle protein